MGVESFLGPFIGRSLPTDLARALGALVLGALAFSAPAIAATWPWLSCVEDTNCWLPHEFNKPVFGEMKPGRYPTPGQPRLPVSFVPPYEVKMAAFGHAHYVYAPEPGVVRQRSTTPQDKADGAFEFVHLAQLNRALRAGDVFGWRMRIHSPGLENIRFSVAELMQVPMAARLFTRPAGPGSSWHEHLFQDEDERARGRTDVFQNANRIRIQADDPVMRSYTTVETFPTVSRGNFQAAGFWRVQRDDPDGDYVVDLWAYNRLITRIYYRVQQGGAP